MRLPRFLDWFYGRDESSRVLNAEPRQSRQTPLSHSVYSQRPGLTLRKDAELASHALDIRLLFLEIPPEEGSGTVARPPIRPFALPCSIFRQPWLFLFSA